MVLKSAFIAAVCTGLLASAGPAAAAEYRPGEFLKLDLPKAVLSPKRIGPETQFGPVRIEARSDADDAEADLDASVWPKLPPRKAHVARSRAEKPSAEKPRAEPPRAAARAKLAKRRGNPLDAQARDTRIQTWPCKSGGICNWQR
ncbi:hypothetical protein LJR220_004382 [Bradyrhizobium sp. LjRoot220]|uniref:hypothetical protein n=1 Tax=Bradyrhizobium sp. LjRoot220 TaxID=3342284 RepID=UPI003ECF27F9